MRSLALLTLLPCLVFHSACGDEVCGPDSLAADTLVSETSGAAQVIWADFKSSPNNDCGEAGGPTSLTLEATQVGNELQSLVLCVPRPDKVSGKTIDVGDTTRVRIIDVFAAPGDADCQASLDRSRAPSGTIAFHGVCSDGLAVEGYSLDVAMTLPLSVSCAGVLSEDELRFDGAVRVRAE